MNRSIKSVIDSAKDNSSIDMSYIGRDVWVAHIETNDIFENLKLTNFPPNITELKFGYNLSNSIVSPITLPPYVNTYTGPVLNDMIFPDSLRTVSISETKNSICFSKIGIPSGVTDITVVTIDKLSNVDELKLPLGLEYFRIDGPFNSSIDRLNLENLQNLKKITLPDSFIQPFNITKHNLIIEKSDDLSEFPIEFKENIFGMETKNTVINSTHTVNDAIRKYIPSLNHLKIKLDEDIPSISHIWSNILMEGLVNVKTISVDSILSTNVFQSIHLVFDRSYVLNRTVCKNLFINNVNFDENMTNSYLNLSRSLKRIGDMNIIIHHTNNVSLHGIAKRMASVLNMNHYVDGVYSSLFGSIQSMIYVNKNTLIINRGQIHKQFKAPIDKDNEDNNVVPVPSSSSSLVVPMEDIVGNPPPIKDIILISWSKCVFCKKQEEIIDSLKSELNNSLFDEKVTIETVDDPSKVSDKRVTSFPSWVVNGSIQAGVKDKEEINKLIKQDAP